jgi:uncharacterized damage-inducible protein DinB
MKRMSPILLTLLALGLSSAAFPQQPKEPEKKATIASVLDRQLSIVEHEFFSAAEAMPEEKYSFAPTNGEFKGVRTFAQQVKHVAAANYLFFSAILGEKPPEGDENGPASVKTKAEILKYLRESYAMGHRAFATITPENAVTPVEHPLSGPFNNRLAIASIACWHPFDHYGQMVEYLRMNGIIPPASRPQPPPSGQ